MSEQALQILKTVFGYDEFRSHQSAIIENILKRNDTLAIMPTGGGKSICYQIPALIFPGLTLVISPLISLMEDQVNQLQALGIPAALLNSTLSSREYLETLGNVQKGTIKLLYMAPETLMLERTRQLLDSIHLDCLTIDEAHCISEWGHDFRPEYRQLAGLRQQFPNAVCVALTATATPQVQQDIKNSLQMADSNEFIASFNRTNLFLEVIEKQNPVVQTLRLIEKYPNQSGIIYCNSRRQVDELTAVLAGHNCSVAAYHAGLTNDERAANQSAFIRDDIQIIVATIAFGMGINKPNVRFVLHFDMPRNIESYYQQIGRAGRDGLPAYCHFLFGYGDIQKVKFFINQKSESEQRIANLHLNTLIAFAEAEECRRIPLLHYFGEHYTLENCQLCDNCLSEKQPLCNVTVPAQKFLSCIYRTGQLFGAAYLIDVLRGSKAKKVLERQHDQLPTYGIGTELTKPQWQQLSRKLLQENLIIQDQEFGSLKLTEAARTVLKGERQIEIRLTQRPEFTGKSKTAAEQQTQLDYNHTLFHTLRACRKVLADQENVPPYIIFSDKSLMEMATWFPQSKESLLQINGVGQVKLDHYGDAFLDEITRFCSEHQIAEIARPSRTVPLSSSVEKKVASGRHIEIGELFTRLGCLDQMQSDLNIKLSTTLSHLYKYQSDVAQLPTTDAFICKSSLAPDQQDRVMAAMAIHGTERLRPVFEELRGEISYDELHLLRLHYLTHR
ncbi:DNA helicase RecQ [Endozoicomonas sp. SCSIO W0465]|uniref:DNA helicase RecQ n=1 Tax=Endozoicomonas sp. SCSIO W0465 TaxID=2918516 RepID=UPI0020756054|nr:DNA helicase RecQ [Endozoicomonas sp. SCSIO W0465]USE34301.1 DNA helicase RecQ [Endozoicomonas sp. SCSIO W0465]